MISKLTDKKMKMAVQAQLCREALCANTAPELISIWTIKKEE